MLPFMWCLASIAKIRLFVREDSGHIEHIARDGGIIL